MTERPPRRRNTSAGLLLFKRTGGALRVFLAHPGGPFWRKHDEHSWTIPKGLVEAGEGPREAAPPQVPDETRIDSPGPLIPLAAGTSRSGANSPPPARR